MGSVSSTESSDTISSDYSHSLTSSAPLLAASLSGGCPLRHRASSGSSAEDDIGHLTQNGLTITPVVRAVPPQHHIRYRKLDSPTDSGIESGNEKPDHKPAPSSGSSSCSSPRSSVEDVTEEKKFHVEDMPVLKRVLQAPPLYDTNSLMDEAYKPHKKFRAMRHRESEAEPESSNSINNNNHNNLNNNSSSNLINNSSNHNNVSNTNSTHHHTTTITAHPIHHHVIQQTSSTTNTTLRSSPQHHLQVNNTNSNLSQSQQQHHQNTLHPQQSQLHMHLTRPQHQTTASSLSSTHSVLAKSLMEEPRMTPEQMKRSDIIQNYIMRESQQENGGYRSPHPSSSSTSSSSSSSSPHPHIPSSAVTNQHQGLLVVSGRWQPTSGPTSVITTTRNHSPSPNALNDAASRYYQSPHSTSSSASSSPPQSIKSPRLLELQVDIADAQQPLNLSKKSPTPPRSLHKIKLEA
jgi:nuclear receptor subfamily 1 group D protein 3